mmetsp:Transcript_26387/g.73780  ORF Transcript_26387/g.73780 Transcript_26387/m.73780 type:complete len:89 (+) Transcript_26387:744-1010(+)
MRLRRPYRGEAVVDVLVSSDGSIDVIDRVSASYSMHAHTESNNALSNYSICCNFKTTEQKTATLKDSSAIIVATQPLPTYILHPSIKC